MLTILEINKYANKIISYTCTDGKDTFKLNREQLWKYINSNIPINQINIANTNNSLSRQEYWRQKREQIEIDIKQGVNICINSKNGKYTFEFEGDYDYEHLVTHAKKVAQDISAKMAWEKFELTRKDFERETGIDTTKLRKRLHYEYRIAQINSKQMPDRKHVYCTININLLDKYVNVIKKEYILAEDRRKRLLNNMV